MHIVYCRLYLISLFSSSCGRALLTDDDGEPDACHWLVPNQLGFVNIELVYFIHSRVHILLYG